MTTTPPPDPRDQRITLLRAALTEVLPLLSFSAGLLAASNPEYAAQMMAAGAKAETALNLTAPGPANG
ncbi:hypothetical protein OG875_05060 [Streptomyces sp. NBC_01498]|uniref:hypothetical protein n=1 Tax=Streptomyces sp. NBC_01498 TaxID=2975870 RepID=UPI002E7B0D3D|nr:hypothetical protein [Streptomyces sp. NBC_01498]WTL24027.1 hypothetical protein OG875_05060 [Streptomyces sp. NBC_01498]